jgi:hypothetical protein
MTEGEPCLQGRPHGNIQRFFEVLDQTVGTTENGETGASLIPQDKRDEVHAMAQTVDELFANGEPTSGDLIAALKARHSHELKGHPKEDIGFFKTLHAVSGDRLGRTGEKTERTGFKLVFAVIPKGHTAPSHIHRDLQVPTGFGELTASLQGTLRYVTGPDGALQTHTRQDEPRLSPNGSPDIYLMNQDLWVGVYVQPENCDIPTGEFAEMLKITRLALEKALAGIVD